MIEREYYEKVKKAESIEDLRNISKEIYVQICRESLIDGKSRTMDKIYTLATIVLKMLMFRDW